jgi:hypothetical protein
LRAGILKEQTMQLGFAIALYPSKTYLDAAALAAAKDERQRRSMEAANKRLHAALNSLGTTNLLLHIVGDKVLQLSTLNLDTLQLEAPHDGFWEVRNAAACFMKCKGVDRQLCHALAMNAARQALAMQPAEPLPCL